MDELIVKYAFTYGPLMIFFFAVGYAIYRATPTVLVMFREIIAALNSSTIALNNSTSALSANNDAMVRHHETMASVREMWDEMRERIDTFQCPVHAQAAPSRRQQRPPTKTSSRKVRVLVEQGEVAKAA